MRSTRGSKATVEILLLGPIEARSAGRPVALGGPLARALLARLALADGEAVTVDRLVEDLWADADRPASARHAVRVYASRLRASFGDNLAARAGGYALDLPADGLDVRRFQRLADDGRRALDAGDPAAAAILLADALGLWRGPALADVAYAEWAQHEIARLDELRAAALEERVEADLRLGRHAALVPELDGLVREHPLRERLRRQLMLALYRSGRQADALGAYREARAALVDDLGLEPSAELRALEAAILRHDPALVVEPEELRRRRRLPAPRTQLIGRRREVDAVAALLRGPARLVSITGPGGIGKTRVALQAAHDLAPRFEHGVVFVDLTRVQDPGLVVDAVAGALDVAEEPGRARVDLVRDHLRERAVLLVLDNFEHVDAAAPLVSELLDGCAGLAALTTSRSPLRLYGEHVFELPELSLEDEAVPLFVARAQAVARGFSAGPRVAEICRRLDCLPLAVELAAARVPELTLDEIASTLPRLDVAADGPRDLPGRQRTLRGAIAWSDELLDEPLRRAFARLGVFVAGWSEEAGAALGAGPTECTALASRALVRGEGERVAMLETIREYALEQLTARGELEDARRCHAEHLVALAEAAQEALSTGRDHVRWLDRLDTEHANLRAALSWAIERRDATLALRLCVGLGWFWEWRGHVREAGGWLSAALALDGPVDETRARALLRASAFAHLRGDLDGATALGEELLAAADALGDLRLRASGLRKLATLAKDTGAHDRSAELHEEALAVSRRAEDRPGVSSSLINLADLALARGDYEQGRELAEESVALARELHDPMRELVSLLNLGYARLGAGEPKAAEALARVIDLSVEARYADGLAYALEGLARLSSADGEHEGALRLVGAAEALLTEAGSVLEAAEQRVHDATVAAARAQLGAERADKAMAAGRALSLEQAASAGREAAAARA